MNRFSQKMLGSFLIFLSILFLYTTLSFAAPAHCENLIQIRGNNTEECDRAADQYQREEKYQLCASTHWLIRLNEAINQCYVNIMNRELDKRLLPLKEKDKAQFEKEMELQKTFNESVKKFCNRYNECEGTMYQPIVPNCYANLNRYRAKQVAQINQSQLELSKQTASLRWSKEFKKFAEQFEVYPDSIWKEKKAPSNRTDRILSELEKVIHVDSEDICALE